MIKFTLIALAAIVIGTLMGAGTAAILIHATN